MLPRDERRAPTPHGRTGADGASGAERVPWTSGRLQFGRLVLEAVMIAFSVLLALSAQNWNDHRKQELLAREALANIRAEIGNNAARIRGEIPEQQKVADALQVYREALQAGRNPPPPQISLHPPFFSSAAWSTALSTQALAHVDFREVQSLAAFYEMRHWLDRLEDTWLRLLTERRDDGREAEERWLDNMRSVMLGYIEIENVLVAHAEVAAPGASKR